MRRPSPSRQQGFGLLTFVILTAMVVLAMVSGYSGLLTQQAANALVATQQKYLLDMSATLDTVWDQHAAMLDDPSPSNTVTAAQVLQLAGISPRHGATLVLSNVMVSAADNVAFRYAALYLPAETDATNPPDLAHFMATGEFRTCIDPDAECAERQFRVFSSLDAQRELSTETHRRLKKVAAKAQTYFKARMLQDPERSIDINYFRRPSGTCYVSGSMDLDCLDNYTPLVGTRAAQALGLSDEELYTAWGAPIEASNLQDSNTGATPFSMAFRARRPLGDFMTVRAVQQL